MAKRKKKKARKRRAYVVRSKAEKLAILKRYDKAPYGERMNALYSEGIGYSHIYAWRLELGKKGKRAKGKRKVRRA